MENGKTDIEGSRKKRCGNHSENNLLASAARFFRDIGSAESE
jgi:hypothetical protein